MPNIIFSDGTLKVEVGINMRASEEGVTISNQHAHQDVSNSIKITVNSPQAKLVQLVTRIVPDLFEYGQNNKIQWNTEIIGIEPHYMPNHDTPRWKVDTADDTSCSYDSAGVHKRTGTQASFYDCPGWNLRSN